MKHFLSVLFLAVFGLAISASAEFKVTQAQIKALEKELANSELVNHPLTDDDFDDSDDSGKRGWNPISWVKKTLKNKCVCENNTCDCCFKLKLFQKSACLSAETLPAEQKISIRLTLDDKSLVEKKFGLDKSGSVCGPAPIPSLSFLTFCLNQKSGVEANGAISSCSNVEFKVTESTGAVLQFKCLELKSGKITVAGYKELAKSNMFVLKAKNPFKAAVKFFKKATGKK